MTPIIETVDGKELALRLTIDDLDAIARVNPQFGEIAAAMDLPVWDWREVKAIASAALRPHDVPLQTLLDERGIDGCRALAARVFAAAMPVASPGKPDAGAETDGSTRPA